MPKSIFHVAVDPLFVLRVPTVKQLVWHKCRKGSVEERYIQQRAQTLHSASWIIDSGGGEKHAMLISAPGEPESLGGSAGMVWKKSGGNVDVTAAG